MKPFKITSHDNERIQEAILREFDRLGLVEEQDFQNRPKAVGFVVGVSSKKKYWWLRERQSSFSCWEVPEITLTDLMQMEPEPKPEVNPEDELVEVYEWGKKRTRKHWKRLAASYIESVKAIHKAIGEPEVSDE